MTCNTCNEKCPHSSICNPLAEKTIKIQQIGSPIRRPKIQRLYLKSLGLNKMNRIRVVQDSPGVRGLLKKLTHMVKVIER